MNILVIFDVIIIGFLAGSFAGTIYKVKQFKKSKEKNKNEQNSN